MRFHFHVTFLSILSVAIIIIVRILVLTGKFHYGTFARNDFQIC